MEERLFWRVLLSATERGRGCEKAVIKTPGLLLEHCARHSYRTVEFGTGGKSLSLPPNLVSAIYSLAAWLHDVAAVALVSPPVHSLAKASHSLPHQWW